MVQVEVCGVQLGGLLLHVANDAVGPTKESKIARTWRRYSTIRVNILLVEVRACFAMPLGQHRRRHLNILTKFIGRIPTQESRRIKKGRFPLGEFEIGG